VAGVLGISALPHLPYRSGLAGFADTGHSSQIGFQRLLINRFKLH